MERHNRNYNNEKRIVEKWSDIIEITIMKKNCYLISIFSYLPLFFFRNFFQNVTL